MNMNKKEKHVIYLALSISRVIFLFWDYFLSNNKVLLITPSTDQHTTTSLQKTYEVDQSKLNQNIESDLQDVWLPQEQIDSVKLEEIKQDRSNKFDDIQILKNIYSKTKNINVFNILLDKLVQNYQFDEAKSYIQNFNNWNYSKNIDANLYLHILINSLSTTNPNEIIYFETTLSQISKSWLLGRDDESFYLWLIKIRNKDRNAASKIFKTISSPRYAQFIKNYFDTLNNSYLQDDIPVYYKDGLIALTMLKNWYFSIAKKIALSIVMKDDTYILPYQILAYSHFLTNNRETAIDYLFKLIDINPTKEKNYKFLIWVSYYRDEKYEESVLYLSQIKDKIYQTDVYRYLILNYIAWNDNTKLVRMWQSILWQDNLEKSDFYNFFYNVFFLAFTNQEKFEIYDHNPELSISFLDKCYQTFSSWDADICIYWQAGQDIASSNRNWAKDKLLYLGERYPQWYIFHALWDYYLMQQDLQMAKKYYLKAVTMTTSEIEKTIIRKKLIE